ncbi:hypothetical protein ACLKA7_012717 [Drosophila subpalustris]
MPLGRKSPEVLAGKEAIPAQSPKLHAAAVPYYPGQRQLAVAMANSSACHLFYSVLASFSWPPRRLCWQPAAAFWAPVPQLDAAGHCGDCGAEYELESPLLVVKLYLHL